MAEYSITVTLPGITPEDLEVLVEGLEVLRSRKLTTPYRGSAPRTEPVKPLRDYFLRNAISATDVANALDWRSKDGFLDGYRVLRALGLRSYDPGKGYATGYRERLGYGQAVRIARAMGADPVDFDL